MGPQLWFFLWGADIVCESLGKFDFFVCVELEKGCHYLDLTSSSANMVAFRVDIFCNKSQALEVRSGGSAGLMTLRAANGFCDQREGSPFMPSVLFMSTSLTSVRLARMVARWL